MDATETLYKLAQAAAPGATVRASVLLQGGGNVVLTRLCVVVLSGPDIIGEVSTQGHSPEAAAAGLKALWMAARRRRDVEVLYRECVRYAEAEYDPDELARWQQRMSTSQMHYSKYLAEVGRLKSQATQQHSLA